MEYGNYGVLLSTFNDDGSFCEQAFRKEVEYCSTLPIAGLMVCGSTGEFPYLDEALYRKEMEIAIAGCGDKELIAGISAPSDSQVLTNMEIAHSLGYRQFMCCPPYYYHQNDAAVVDFYKYISKHVPSDSILLLYNIPSCTSRITANAFAQLCGIDNIQGMKDSSGDMVFFSQCLSIARHIGKKFWLYSGVDTTYLPSLAAGGAGLISSAAWLLAREEKPVLDCYLAGNMEEAQGRQQDITHLCMTLDSIPFPENYRAMAEAIGIDCCGKPRRHFSCLEGAAYAEWKKEAKARFDALQAQNS